MITSAHHGIQAYKTFAATHTPCYYSTPADFAADAPILCSLQPTPYSIWGVTQLVEHLTEKPDTILTRDVGSSPRHGKGFFPQSTFSVYSYGVCTAPVCNGMPQHLCAH